MSKSGDTKGQIRSLARTFRVAGPILYSLRLARGWTQVEAADRAGISERLLRTAERSGKLGFRSIMILAQLYSTVEKPLLPENLVTEPLPCPLRLPDGAETQAQLEQLISRWCRDLWGTGQFSLVVQVTTPDCRLHARGKTLRGQASIRRYMTATRAALGDLRIVAQRPTIYDNLAMMSWRMHVQGNLPCDPFGTPGQPEVIRGATWIRAADGLVCEIWDYWHCWHVNDMGK